MSGSSGPNETKTPIEGHASNEISETPVVSDEAQRKSRRRRLLKGVAAGAVGVPVIMTMRSGAAGSAASNFNCLATMGTGLVNAERCVAAGSSDGYQRNTRSAFSGGVGDTTTAGELTGGDDATTDLCLLYYDSGSGAAVDITSVDTPWGRDGSNVKLTATCWSSFQ
ncbi:MAG: hypothetical protein HQL53_05860 [Magnetococcales bacterium]|nr:hypothetical protein [Magnetococcales bacterium]